MFKGQYQHNLDDKGRLVLPTKFREELGEGAVITIGFENCLTIYTAKEWENYTNELFSKSMTNLAVRRTMRRLTGNASDIDLDKSGRLKIPSNLLSDANIVKDVTIVGLGAYIEVWATEQWQKEQELDKQEYESNAEQLYHFGKGND